MFSLPRALLLAFAVNASMAAVAAPARAHEGHDHGPPQPELQTTAAPRAEAQSDAFELVAIARDGGLTIYLDRFRTNEPVKGATIEIETPDGPRQAVAVEDRYRLEAPWAAAPGAHDLLVTVTHEDVVDVLTATLVVPDAGAGAPRPASAAGRIAAQFTQARLTGAPAIALAAFAFAGGLVAAAAARSRNRKLVLLALLAVAAATWLASSAFAQNADAPVIRDVARRLPDGSVFMPKQTQRLLEIRTLFAASDAYVTSLQLPGRVIADPNASGYVQAAVSGRLSAPAKGFPRLGARVNKGDVLAYVTPPLSAAETSDQRQRQGELDQQISIVQQRIARFEKLIGSGAVARVQLDEARIELDALRDRRQALDQARREPEPLVAPVDGVIAAANAIAGQIADANAIVFQIVDPGRLWIEAQSLQAPDDVASAEARTPDGRRFELAFKGAGLADRSQFVPVQFSLAEGEKSLRIGQLVTVYLRTGAAAQGLAVPRAAVLTGANGQSVVFEHSRAERFEPREVRVAPLDAGRVLILAGVTPGRRVVVQGAELLNQVR